MRAYQLPKGGAGIESLTRVDVPEPKPQHRQVLVKVAACSLNFRDLGIVRGTYRMPVRDNIVPGINDLVAKDSRLQLNIVNSAHPEQVAVPVLRTLPRM